MYKNSTPLLPRLPQSPSIIDQNVIFLALAMLISTPTRNDIHHHSGRFILPSPTGHELVRALLPRHIHVINIHPQFLLAPREFLRATLVGTRHARQYGDGGRRRIIRRQILLQLLPQGLAVGRPRQVGVELIGLADAAPHHALVGELVGGASVEEFFYAGVEVYEDSVEVAEDFVLR